MKRLWIILWLALLPFYAGAIDRSEILLARSAARQHGGDVEWYLLITQTLQEAGLKDVELFYRLFNHWSHVFKESGEKELWIEVIEENDEYSEDFRAFRLRNVNWFAFVIDIRDSDTFSSADIRRKFGSELSYDYSYKFRPYTLLFTALLRDAEWREEVRKKIIDATGNDPEEMTGDYILFPTS